MNRALRHVTVLEEAHHLLKKTSTEQSSETANLLGKSVEMLSQSIAEMRTFGEGFIIADQSPNMLDMSVIRNTNTKIILRLPDMSDRELCGRAASLNDEQIVELAKLPTGVAAVYQNNWIEPVLCKVKHFVTEEKEYTYTPAVKMRKTEQLRKTILRCLLAHSANERVEYSVDDLSERVIKSDFSAHTKRSVLEAIQKDKRGIPDVCEAVTSLFDTSGLIKSAVKAENIQAWNRMLTENLGFDFDGMDAAYSTLTLQCIIRQKSIEFPELELIYSKWTAAMRGGVV